MYAQTSQTSYKPITVTLLGTASALLAQSSPFSNTQLQHRLPPPPITAFPEQYGLYYSNGIYYTSPGFISYLFLVSILLFQLDIKELYILSYSDIIYGGYLMKTFVFNFTN